MIEQTGGELENQHFAFGLAEGREFRRPSVVPHGMISQWYGMEFRG